MMKDRRQAASLQAAHMLRWGYFDLDPFGCIPQRHVSLKRRVAISLFLAVCVLLVAVVFINSLTVVWGQLDGSALATSSSADTGGGEEKSTDQQDVLTSALQANTIHGLSAVDAIMWEVMAGLMAKED